MQLPTTSACDFWGLFERASNKTTTDIELFSAEASTQKSVEGLFLITRKPTLTFKLSLAYVLSLSTSFSCSSLPTTYPHIVPNTPLAWSKHCRFDDLCLLKRSCNFYL